MNRKLPYYMAYPMPLAYDDEKVERRDFEYMKSLYPDMARRILPYVEEECDRLDYHCSMMYDEYPDKLQLRLAGNRIYDNICDYEKFFYGQPQQKSFMEGVMDQHPNDLPGYLSESERLGDEGASYNDRLPYEDVLHHGRIPCNNRTLQAQRKQDWLHDLIDIMLLQELYKRRCDNRRHRRKFY